MLKVFTSNYRYGGDDRFDISVKGKLHPEFAPTWSMVKGIKEGTMTEDEYTKLYHDLMINSWKNKRDAWDRLLSMDMVTLVCFCPNGSFCHRYLLAGYLVKCGAKYMGDR